MNTVAAVLHRVARSDLAYRTDQVATSRGVSKTETSLVASNIGRIAIKTSRIALKTGRNALKTGRNAFKTEINLGWTSGSAEFGATLVLGTIETIPAAIASIPRITLSSASLRRGGCVVALIM